MITLHGSTTSPYVRRLRIVLHDSVSHLPFTLQRVQVFETAYRAAYATLNPVMKVPTLVDGDVTLYDSNVIAEYLYDKGNVPFLSITQKNTLSVINGLLDGLVQVLILSREGVDKDTAPTYIGLQQSRAELCLSHLDALCEAGEFDEWHYASISLFTALDWIAFRAMATFEHHSHLRAFYHAQITRESVTSTDPRS